MTYLATTLDEIEDLDRLYWRACTVASNPILREKLEGLADYVTDRQ